MSNRQRVLLLGQVLVVGLLVVPALAAGAERASASAVSDDPEPILGAIGDGPDPFRAHAISDDPEPISGVQCERLAVPIDDDPDPIHRIISEPIDRVLVYLVCLRSVMILMAE